MLRMFFSLLALGIVAGEALAQDPPVLPEPHQEGQVQGPNVLVEPDHEAAAPDKHVLLEPNLPRTQEVPGVACYARPADTWHYRGDYVGGGCACHGDPPYPTEGTWGWDYQGCLIPVYPFLRWCHCDHYQGGSGAYKTDGPKFPPH